MDQSESLDLASYLARIGMARPPAPDVEALRALHAAHLSAIPFENVDVRLGRPIALDLASLEAKLVRGRRGGYCFEQNTLFAAALRALGYQVATLEARVRPPGATRPLPRTHMLLAVEAGGRRWLADVGFGGDGPVEPVPLDGEAVGQGGEVLRVASEGDATRVLQARGEGGWRDLYAFGLSPALPVDFAVASHFTSTWPLSPFVTTLTVQRTTRETRFVLRGRTYAERRGGVVSSRPVAEAEVLDLLRSPFGLDLPAAEALRALGPPPEPAAAEVAPTRPG